MISDTDMDVLHVLRLRKSGELQINCSLENHEETGWGKTT